MLSSLIACMTLCQPATIKVVWKTERDDKQAHYSASWTWPKFVGSSPLVQPLNDAIAQYLDKSKAQWKQAKTDQGESANEAVPYELRSKGLVSLLRANLVSLLFTEYRFTGGAHGVTEYSCINVAEIGSGARRIGLRDVLAESSTAGATLQTQVIDRLKALNASYAVKGQMAELTPLQQDSFVVTPSGLSFVFAPYEAGPYSDGSFTVKLPFDEIRTLLSAGGPLAGLLSN